MTKSVDNLINLQDYSRSICVTGVLPAFIRGYNVIAFCCHFYLLFFFCQIKFVCISVAVCELVHVVETVSHLCLLLTASVDLQKYE